MNALANEEVGKYLNSCFVSTYQKIGTFTINGGQKQGGNVASYFCTADGRVLHSIAGPVNADVLLREARWIVETSKLAQLDGAKSEAQVKTFWRKAHAERLKQEHNLDLTRHAGRKGRNSPRLDNQGRVHLLLATASLPKLEQVYKLIFEKILNEKVSTAPVVQVRR